MRAVIQRVKEARVKVDGAIISEIKAGFLVLLAIKAGDSETKTQQLAEKIVKLRIFEDQEEKMKMNNSLLDVDGEILVVSQFTLYGDTKKGNRPSFIESARPEEAKPLYEKFIEKLRDLGVRKVASGRFGAYMSIELVNEGPTTIIIDL